MEISLGLEQRDYPRKPSHKISLPLLAERGEGRGEEPNSTVSRGQFWLLVLRRFWFFSGRFAFFRRWLRQFIGVESFPGDHGFERLF